MEESALSPLASWEAFYLIVGSAAAALTGLQFVVIVLGADVSALSTSTTRAFGTPTIVHFGAVLLVSAIVTAPWSAPSNPAVGLGACGVAGVAYAVMVARRARRQTEYVPVLEDWIWHAALPLLAYAALLAAAVVLPGSARQALFAVGASAVLLLFIGIHNAWDAVTYIAITRTRGSERDSEDRSMDSPNASG
jgi:hypothetical protein